MLLFKKGWGKTKRGVVNKVRADISALRLQEAMK